MPAIKHVGEANARGITVNTVIDKETGNSLEYRHLIKHPKYKEVWTRSYANELGRLTNGIRDIPGTCNTFAKVTFPRIDSKMLLTAKLSLSNDHRRKKKNALASQSLALTSTIPGTRQYQPPTSQPPNSSSTQLFPHQEQLSTEVTSKTSTSTPPWIVPNT